MKTKIKTSEIYRNTIKYAGSIAVLAALLMICAGANHNSDRIAAATQNRIKAQEYKLKAVYLYNFLLFTEWPDSGGEVDNSITIGILGSDPFDDNFSEVEDRMIRSKKRILRIKKLGKYNRYTMLDQCDLLFISSSESKNFQQILQDLEGMPILTVADTENFLQSGGMINLVKSGNKIRWEVNRSPIKKANLRLNSQLLRNAVKVID